MMAKDFKFLDAREVTTLRCFLEANKAFLSEGLFIEHDEEGDLRLKVLGIGSRLVTPKGEPNA